MQIYSKVFKIEIVTAPTALLRKLQKVYPTSKITNQFLDIFEILSFYCGSIRGEDRIAVTESSKKILQEFAHVAKTLKPYLGPNSKAFSEDERQRLIDYFDIDSDSILEMFDEN